MNENCFKKIRYVFDAICQTNIPAAAHVDNVNQNNNFNKINVLLINTMKRVQHTLFLYLIFQFSVELES